MATAKKNAATMPPGTAASGASAPTSATVGGRWWLILQGSTFTILQSQSAPDLSVNPGERMKKSWGSFPTEAEAVARRDRILATKTVLLKEGM
jgi:hypothetical protein